MDRAKYKENYYLLLISFEKYTIIAITQKAVLFIYIMTHINITYMTIRAPKRGRQRGKIVIFHKNQVIINLEVDWVS